MDEKTIKQLFYELICKLTSHEYYLGAEESDVVRCRRCNQWCNTNNAYGKWV